MHSPSHPGDRGNDRSAEDLRTTPQRPAAGPAPRREDAFMRLLQAVAAAANEAATVEEAVQACLDAVCAHTGWPVGHAYVASTTLPRQLNPTAIWHLDDPERFRALRELIERTSLSAGAGLPGRVLASGRPAWIADVTQDPHFPRDGQLGGLPIRAGFAVPVLTRREVVAVLEFFSPDVVEPDDAMLGLAAYIGAQLGHVFERRQAEAERDRFFMLSADMLAVAGLDGYFKRVNPAFERTLGYTAAELTSRPWLDFVHPDDLEATKGEGRKLSEGALTLDFDNRYRCKDGSYKWMSWTSVPVVAEGLIYAVARDTTERKRVEQQLEENNRLLEQAARSEREAHEALKQTQGRLVQSEKLAALGQLVAGVAHEINNPLAFVTNNLAVLQRDLIHIRDLVRLYQAGDALLAAGDPALFQQIRDLAEQIDLSYTLAELGELLPVSREGLERIRHIVRDLREFARQESLGDLQEGADLNVGIQSTINIARGRARKQNVKLELDLAPLPPVTCRPAKINQVLLNLIVNAIDACEGGGDVIVRSRPTADGVQVQVIDTGSGIEPAVRDKIFDPFFTTKPQGQGTGLGLSISHGIAADHGGRIDVDSTPGRGTTFTLHLPLASPRP